MKSLWPFLGLPAGILLGVLVTHGYPYTHTARAENVGILHETIWRAGDGRECGHAYPEVDQPQIWYGFAYAVGGPMQDFPSKEAAYTAIEWWCRP